MLLSTQLRTNDTEIMDDFGLVGSQLQQSLDKIAQINHLLGGNRLTLHGVNNLLKPQDQQKSIKIVDVGCGNGDMLRRLADFGIQNNLNFDLTGIDANDFTIRYAQKLSANYQNISYQCDNIFSKAFSEIKYDIVLCTLTLHHFSNIEIETILKVFNKNARIGIVINDLHRSKIAYYLFKIISLLFSLNTMAKKDGLTSILRGFKKHELIDFSNKLAFKNYSICWKWAFRYQWIIKKY